MKSMPVLKNLVYLSPYRIVLCKIKMEILTKFPQSDGQSASVVAIGNFDGCHRGHQRIFARCAQFSFRRVVIAFTSSLARQAIFTTEQKCKYLADAGYDMCILQELNNDFASLSHQQFLRDYLLRCLQTRVLVVGRNFRFGHNRLGDTYYLRLEEQALSSFQLETVETAYDGAEAISSSRIRKMLSEGDIESANSLLGRAFALEGQIERGQQRGREFGIPTANLAVSPQVILPKRGVYAGSALIDGREKYCAINVGTRPTVSIEQGKQVVEAHLFAEKLACLYDKRMTLFFQHRLRDEKKFPNVQLLVKQIKQDIELAKRLLYADR